MSRDIRQTPVRPGSTQQIDRKKGRLLLTSCPAGLKGNRQQLQEGESEVKHLLAALVREDRLIAVQLFSPDRQSRIGAIYLGKIKKIVKNLNACFVEIAGREQCFLRMGCEKSLPFLTNRAYDGRLLEGDELLVQMQQEAIKTKQAAVTTQITLQGEYFVLATGTSRVGISKKLGESQKDLLRQFLNRRQITDQEGLLVQEEGVPSFGLVVRTQAGLLLEQESGSACEEDLYHEYELLRRQFTAIFLQGRHRTCYSCLHEAGTALEEALKPFLPGEYEELVTDLPQVHEELLRLQEQKRLSLETKQIRLYQDSSFPLDKLYSLETRLEEALGKVVWLKSGANLVIEQTESLTAIDVNTGKCIRFSGDKFPRGDLSPASILTNDKIFQFPHGTCRIIGQHVPCGKENLIVSQYKKDLSPRDTLRQVNLEAAREVVRQLRLRNLSGIIIVDFINLATLAQEKELLQELRELAKADPVTVQVVDMTPLGLVEITRKKVYPSLREQLGRG